MRFTEAEWVINFCRRLSKEICYHIQHANLGIEYVEFLAEQGRPSEALEQCYLIDGHLVEHFGANDSKWLPDAPDLTGWFQHSKKLNTSESTLVFVSEDETC